MCLSPRLPAAGQCWPRPPVLISQDDSSLSTGASLNSPSDYKTVLVMLTHLTGQTSDSRMERRSALLCYIRKYAQSQEKISPVYSSPAEESGRIKAT